MECLSLPDKTWATWLSGSTLIDCQFLDQITNPPTDSYYIAIDDARHAGNNMINSTDKKIKWVSAGDIQHSYTGPLGQNLDAQPSMQGIQLHHFGLPDARGAVMTLQAVFQSPTTGTYRTGDIAFNQNPIGTRGLIDACWICTKGGSPGSWCLLGQYPLQNGEK